MKISLQELRAFEDFIQRVEDGTEKRYTVDKWGDSTWQYYAEHPHLLMLMGFDEYVSFKNKAQFADRWFVNYVEDGAQSIYRKPSGQWFFLWGDPNDRYDSFQFHTERSCREFFEADERGETLPPGEGYPLKISLEALFKKLYEVAGKTVPEEKVLWSPTLWTPSSQERERLILNSSARNILSALKDERMDLSSLSWRQLEDIVAEILRANGLEIHVVRETPQGGRDIIARGELIPGQEPLMMAVEVKHRKVVGRPDLQKALWQNRQLPALLFVTSGRFTAGVIQEKKLPENQLRLFLKDGEALGDLISGYKFL